MVMDLKGTVAYNKLQVTWNTGAAVPKLFVTLAKDVKEMEKEDQWGATLDETVVHMECVIVLRPCTFRSFPVPFWPFTALFRLRPALRLLRPIQHLVASG
jgi:hypothetical protein